MINIGSMFSSALVDIPAVYIYNYDHNVSTQICYFNNNKTSK